MAACGSRFCHVVLCAIVLGLCILLVACSGTSQASSAAVTPGGSSGTGTGGSGGSGSGSSNGTGNTASGSQSSTVMYVSENTQSFSNGVQMPGFIDARVLDLSSGALKPIPGSPFPTNYSNAGDMALAPNGAYAYVLAQQFPTGQCCIGPTFLLVYALDPTSGAPTLKQALAIANPNAPGPTNIAVHPSGQFVYLSNYYQSNSNNAGIGIFSVQTDGALVFVGVGGPLQAESSSGAAIDPNGKFLYTDIDVPPAGNTGIPTCSPFNSNVYAFSIDGATGELTPVSGSPFSFQRQICEIGHAPQWLTLQIDPSGQRLFTVDSGNRIITVFEIDTSSGALTLLPGSTVDTDNTGPSFTASAMDPSGRFLYVGGPSYAFTGFSLTANPASGDLPVLPGMPVQTTLSTQFNAGSRYVAIDPSGTFLFGNENEYTSAFSCCDPDPVVELRIDPNSGALTPMLSNVVTLAGTASKIVVVGPR
jgi:6-phosphogluconolactonase